MTLPKSIAVSSAMQSHPHQYTHIHNHNHYQPIVVHHNAMSIAAMNNNNDIPLPSSNSTTIDTPQTKHEDAKEKPTQDTAKNPSSWDPEDDILLRHLKEVKKMGWKEIAQYFHNRTPNACQFRWRRLKSGNLKSNKTALIDVTEYHGTLKILNNNVEATIKSNGNKKSTAKTKAARANSMQEISPSMPHVDQLPSNPATVPVPHHFKHYTPEPNQILQPTATHQNFVTSQQNSFNGGTSFTKFANPAPALPDPSESQFIKPRANSHGFIKPFSMQPYHTPNPSANMEGEHVGFIPKVFVKSRRSSIAILPLESSAMSPTSSTSNSINNVLNTTLVTSRSRKHSFASWTSRRSSFNVSSNTPSRRGSMVIAPNSMTNGPNSRRESIVKKEMFARRISNTPSNIFPSSYSFVDSPTVQPRKDSRSNIETHSLLPWSKEEDSLLLENKSRNLSNTELSILLPNRTETEIQWRITTMSQEQLQSQNSSDSSMSPSQSPKKVNGLNSTTIRHHNDNNDDHLDPLQRQHNKTPNNISSTSTSKDVSPSPTFNSIDTDDDSSVTTAVGNMNNSSTDMNKIDFGVYNLHSQSVTPRIITQTDTSSVSNQSQHLPSINTIFNNMM